MPERMHAPMMTTGFCPAPDTATAPTPAALLNTLAGPQVDNIGGNATTRDNAMMGCDTGDVLTHGTPEALQGAALERLFIKCLPAQVYPWIYAPRTDTLLHEDGCDGCDWYEGHLKCARFYNIPSFVQAEVKRRSMCCTKSYQDGRADGMAELHTYVTPPLCDVEESLRAKIHRLEASERDLRSLLAKLKPVLPGHAVGLLEEYDTDPGVKIGVDAALAARDPTAELADLYYDILNEHRTNKRGAASRDLAAQCSVIKDILNANAPRSDSRMEPRTGDLLPPPHSEPQEMVSKAPDVPSGPRPLPEEDVEMAEAHHDRAVSQPARPTRKQPSKLSKQEQVLDEIIDHYDAAHEEPQHGRTPVPRMQATPLQTHAPPPRSRTPPPRSRTPPPRARTPPVVTTLLTIFPRLVKNPCCAAFRWIYWAGMSGQ
ncbi:uncharacterized protein BXZ73DRAFT_83568 [Epithele typhae]|uniref:uncharacterized protein n=1 Tax=Epithele typhae TaxID=378194 RepID=UPI002007B621|nr:uncharacterized protein BXZ73DRAFT_83568 [Epithele typhae]KAH9910442.1 hypothetical protein BXZ73DRAFT_83568 [Epithele typhae]